jgi:hypothetical protein
LSLCFEEAIDETSAQASGRDLQEIRVTAGLLLGSTLQIVRFSANENWLTLTKYV